MTKGYLFPFLETLFISKLWWTENLNLVKKNPSTGVFSLVDKNFMGTRWTLDSGKLKLQIEWFSNSTQCLASQMVSWRPRLGLAVISSHQPLVWGFSGWCLTRMRQLAHEILTWKPLYTICKCWLFAPSGCDMSRACMVTYLATVLKW